MTITLEQAQELAAAAQTQQQENIRLACLEQIAVAARSGLYMVEVFYDLSGQAGYDIQLEGYDVSLLGPNHYSISWLTTPPPPTPPSPIPWTWPVTAGGTGLTSCAVGDLLYGSAVNTLSLLPIGSNGKVLQVVAGIPAWDFLGYSSLNLTNSIVNADISSSAAISYSKLNLTGSIVNADISSTADINISKLKAASSNRLVASNGIGGILDVLAAITNDHVLYADANGLPVGEAHLSKSRGGAGADMTGVTFPSTGTLVTEAGSQVLTNKDYDGGTASDTSRLTVPQNTLSTLTGLTRKEATLVYANDVDRLYIDNGSALSPVGAGSGTINYCTNPDAEASASDWAAYANTAGVAPVDGTGGSPNVTFTRTTTAPLEGLGSFLLTKDGANRQGQGASTDFTIAPADQGKQIVVSFVAQSDANYVANDVLMYVVDVTNSRVIQLAPSGIQKADVAGGAQFTGTFQASIDSTSYRLCFHVATTSALAYTLKIDRVLIAPSPVAFAAAVTDFEPYTPTVAGLGTGSGTFRYSLWRRVGDSAHIQFGFTKDGSNGSGSSTVTFTLPPGLSADTAKLTGGNRCAGGAWVASSTNQSAVILTSGGLIGIGNPSFMTGSSFPAGQQVNVDIMVPIAGWGSNVQVGTYDGRTVACRVTSSTTAMTASGVQIVMPTRDYDTHNAYNTTNGEFVAPVAGVYQAKLGMRSASGSWTANNGFFLEWRRNGTTFKTNYNYAAATASFQLGAQGACEIFLNAGDVLTVRGITSINISASGSATDNVLEISLVPGRSTLAAGDTVAFAATKASGSAANGTADVASYTTEFDTTGSFNATTGVFTAPIAGVYSGEACVSYAANATGSRSLEIQVNGTGTARTGPRLQGVSANDVGVSLGFTLRLKAGDTVRVRSVQTSGGSLNFSTSTAATSFSMRRVGS